ncbi:hypothetical protein RBB75_06440 [Tunturibacter empetritectus]|uniref:Uncharacterized protein n=1 Tax=Tunturiibacter empetritectus TaxID=3069691 RepID=A0AAU7ZG01_9BACT
MRLLLRSLAMVALALSIATLSPMAHAADKLNGFYSGSGGLSRDVHRVVLIEFAADGSAIVEQNWHEKDPQIWHTQWKRNKNLITLTFDPASDKPIPEPLVFTFKHGTLTATSWDATTLGVLGPPKLTPFGGKVPQVTSVASCQSLNTTDPRGNCITWDSRR